MTNVSVVGSILCDVSKDGIMLDDTCASCLDVLRVGLVSSGRLDLGVKSLLVLLDVADRGGHGWSCGLYKSIEV